MSDPRFKPAAPFTDTEIAEIEKVLGRELSRDYRDFVQQYGGAYVGGAVDGSDEFPIVAFADASDVLHNIRFDTELQAESAFTFANCVFGDRYVFDRNDAIYFIVNYAGKMTAEKVSDTFQDFLRRIVVNREDEG